MYDAFKLKPKYNELENNVDSEVKIEELEFGDYLLEVDGNHLTIRRKDNKRVNPTFYELLHMKCLAFGARAVAIEFFPDITELVDGEHQRHLFKIEKDKVPNLKTGYMINHII